MTVYIEYVILDNFVIDYMLLKATFALINTRVKKGRLLFCAFLGAVVALIFPIIQVHTLILTVIKIALGLLLPLIATKYKSAKRYYITAVLFITLTFATGGAIIGAFNIFGLSYSNELSVALMFLPVYAVIKAIVSAVKFIYRRKEVIKNVRRVTLSVGRERVEAEGFMDTGNMLFDGDTPVVVCNKELATKLINGLPKMGKLEYATADGKAEMTVIKNVELRIYFSDGQNKIYKVSLGVARGDIGMGYDVILHPTLMEVCDERTCDIERVS